MGLREMNHTKENYDKAKKLHRTTKKMKETIKQAKHNIKPLVGYEIPLKEAVLKESPLMSMVPKRQTCLAHDNFFLSFCLFGAGIFLGIALTLMRV